MTGRVRGSIAPSCLVPVSTDPGVGGRAPPKPGWSSGTIGGKVPSRQEQCRLAEAQLLRPGQLSGTGARSGPGRGPPGVGVDTGQSAASHIAPDPCATELASSFGAFAVQRARRDGPTDAALCWRAHRRQEVVDDLIVPGGPRPRRPQQSRQGGLAARDRRQSRRTRRHGRRHGAWRPLGFGSMSPGR